MTDEKVAAQDLGPPWLLLARKDLGIRETPGKETTPVIRSWLISLGAWWNDDETAWCGVAVAHWMREAGVNIPKAYYRARAWLDWGAPLTKPRLGCVVVFERIGGGHVGLVVGQDQSGRLMVLGGNQGNAVSIAPFARDRVVGYRWPGTAELTLFADVLPTLPSDAASSTREA